MRRSFVRAQRFLNVGRDREQNSLDGIARSWFDVGCAKAAHRQVVGPESETGKDSPARVDYNLGLDTELTEPFPQMGQVQVAAVCEVSNHRL